MSEEQLLQLLQQTKILEKHLADLDRQENSLFSVLRETVMAIESIKLLKETQDSETLMPIGQGTYVKTKTSSSNKVFLNIGANVTVEKDLDYAINYLEARIKEVQVARQDAYITRQKIENELAQGRKQMNNIMQSRGQKSGSGNV